MPNEISFRISALAIEQWEQCHKRYALLDGWRKTRRTPMELLEAGVRLGLTAPIQMDPAIPNIMLLQPWGVTASRRVLEIARDKGVDLPGGKDTGWYEVALHYAGIAQIVTDYLRAPNGKDWRYPGQGVVSNFGFVHKGLSVDWVPSSYLEVGNDGCYLRRVVYVSYWNEDRLYRELHSWRTIGDICVYRMPMVLDIVVLGASKGGKRHGYWTKARRHPHSREIRFKRKHGREEFSQSWPTIWREEHPEVLQASWLLKMKEDGVLKEAYFQKRVSVPKDYHVDRVLEDIARISKIMRLAKETDPMNRSGCDWPMPCPMQDACYAREWKELGDPSFRGMYERQDGGLVNIGV